MLCFSAFSYLLITLCLSLFLRQIKNKRLQQKSRNLKCLVSSKQFKCFGGYGVWADWQNIFEGKLKSAQFVFPGISVIEFYVKNYYAKCFFFRCTRK